MAEQAAAQFSLERIYVKDVSYESPGAPLVFLRQAAPQLDVQLGVGRAAVPDADDLHEVVLTVTVTAKDADKPVFLVEVQQAGLFRARGLTGDTLARALEVSAAYILLPFVRETVNDLVGKGSFPQLLINPINFDALYEQKQAAKQKPAAEPH